MPDAIIHAQNLIKIYENGAPVRALENVSLSVPAGAFWAVMGPSGSGKSTLLHILGTLDCPTSGRVFIDGKDTRALKGNELADFRRATIGFVFQLFNLVPALTALENAMLPLVPYRRGLGFDLCERATATLERVGLSGRLDHLPGQLSGGEQQRVAIARALINHPRIVLADEPTGNVDTKAGRGIVDLLQELNRDLGTTMVMATHDRRITGHADRVVYLRDGQLEANLAAIG